MITVNQEDIEKRIQKKSEEKAETIRKFKKDLSKRNLKKGRVRPKNPTEKQILNRFSEK
ncbi:MAG TPA: hypothetical protein VK108_08010 [Pseudogracilibacillus sp.]|nr:hypothetical protein [Pseudogracilibacillus sp.]